MILKTLSFTDAVLLIAPNFGIYLKKPIIADWDLWNGRWTTSRYNCKIASGRKKDQLVFTTFIGNSLYTCGGGECYGMELRFEAKWQKVKFPKNALSPVFFRGAVVYNEKIWVVNNNDDELTSDFLSPEARTVEKGPSYPVGRNDGCNIQINATTVLITGGHETDHSTLFVNLETKEWTVGPNLNYNRHKHCCALVVNTDGKTLAIGNMYTV